MLSRFASPSGGTDWDAVIDAEVARRRRLELFPEPSELVDEVKARHGFARAHRFPPPASPAPQFDTSVIPWWAWVRRFHLPEAERVNGRAAVRPPQGR